jgi:ABC-2 type transport system ATP-binding protein
MNGLAIRTDGLTRDFGRQRALDHLNLEIPAGQIVALLGPNGAGKTTLLRSLLGLLEPTTGKAWVLDHDARSMPAEACSRVAGMCEGHEPPGWATLKQLIDLQAAASPKFDRSYAEDFLLGRELRLNKSYGSLSKGQKRWVLAGLNLATGAEVLLLDEPADGLDPAARKELYGQLRGYTTDHATTVLVATHIISDIEGIADDVAIINHGKLVLYDSLEILREQVRQVEWPEDVPLPDLEQGITLLGQTQHSGASIAWIKGENMDEKNLPGQWNLRATVRTVGLETLYLALVEPAEKAVA